ncbi:MAG: DUF3526 domain-containing protein [Isosphaeraceae bacterium]|nr:DUF3526 domain-containing protein [Isosphaeraceae bacterium]
MSEELESNARGRRVSPALVVARREWVELLRDARWVALVGIVVALIVAALAVGIVERSRQTRERAAAAEGDRRVWTAQGPKNPHSAAHFGQYAFKPIGLLAIADPGVDAYAGSAVYLEAHKQNEDRFRSARDLGSMSRLARLSFAFVLQIVLPLIAVILGHSAYSGERERGTLPLALGLGADPRALFLGKALAGASVLLGLLAIATAVLCLGIAIFLPEVELEADFFARLAGLVPAYAIYILGFFGLALAVSAAARGTRTAFVSLLVFWMLNGFVAPRVAGDIASRLQPLPTGQAFRDGIAEAKRAQFGHDEKHPAFVAFRNRVLAEYGVDRVEDLPVSFRGLSLREDDHAGYRIFDEQFGRLRDLVARQDRLRSWAGFAFPLLALQPISTAMAGTDNAHHHEFIRSAELHRRRIQDAASAELMEHGGVDGRAYVAPASLWEAIPSFSPTFPDARLAWRGRSLDFLRLGGWSACCWLAAWAATIRPRAA